MRKFIMFNTRKKAEHYVKHKNANPHPYVKYDSEQVDYYTVREDKVLNVYGWVCGCGCGRGSMSAKVVGRIK